MYNFHKTIFIALLFATSVTVSCVKKPDETPATQPDEYVKASLIRVQFFNMPFNTLDVRSVQILDEQNSILGSMINPQQLYKPQFPQDLYSFSCIATTRLSDSIRLNIAGTDDLGQPRNHTFKYKLLPYRPTGAYTGDKEVTTEIRVEQGWNFRMLFVFSKQQ